MIYKLRKKFIAICFISLMATFLLILSVVFILSQVQTNQMLDTLSDMISENGGVFPNFDFGNPAEGARRQPLINRETPYTTRFFVVYFDSDGTVTSIDTKFISSVTEGEAEQFAETAIKKGRERGWMSGYRYKIYSTADGEAVVFVDGNMVQSSTSTIMVTVSAVFAGSSIIVLLLILTISKRVVRPMAESYDKQKQFVADANHELKTPLTLILANVDIAAGEVGENEWLNDIRTEGKRMGVLINQLGSLARMDEQDTISEISKFNLSDAVSDTASGFQILAAQKNIEFTVEVASDVCYEGDETEIRRLISILIDNAIKYCDPSGRIRMGLAVKKRPFVWMENTCAAVETMQLDRLFDRFYRAEQARTSGGGFGIGLSIAKSIVEKHHGKIEAHNIQNNIIRFDVKL